MSTTHTICDHCGEEIAGEPTSIFVASGELRVELMKERRTAHVDLCMRCASPLKTFLVAELAIPPTTCSTAGARKGF